MKNKVYRNDPCPCGSGKKFKKCCIKNLTQIEKEVEGKVGEKVKISFLEQNCDIDAMKKAGLLEDMGDGLYRVKEFKSP